MCAGIHTKAKWEKERTEKLNAVAGMRKQKGCTHGWKYSQWVSSIFFSIWISIEMRNSIWNIEHAPELFTMRFGIEWEEKERYRYRSKPTFYISHTCISMCACILFWFWFLFSFSVLLRFWSNKNEKSCK